jgi:hypothetical protein
MDTKHIIINGDSRQMSELKDQSVHLIMSPLYRQLSLNYKDKFQSI